jgi:uncharacterized protein (DUF983 family)
MYLSELDDCSVCGRDTPCNNRSDKPAICTRCTIEQYEKAKANAATT